MNILVVFTILLSTTYAVAQIGTPELCDFSHPLIEKHRSIPYRGNSVTPPGFENHGGGILGCGFGVQHLASDTLSVFLLTKFIESDDSGGAYSVIADYIAVKNMNKNTAWLIRCCLIDGQLDNKVFAIAPFENEMLLKNINLSWQLDCEAGTLVPVLPSRVACYNESLGL
jgi:hypothetical protein